MLKPVGVWGSLTSICVFANAMPYVTEQTRIFDRRPRDFIVTGSVENYRPHQRTVRVLSLILFFSTVCTHVWGVSSVVHKLIVFALEQVQISQRQVRFAGCTGESLRVEPFH